MLTLVQVDLGTAHGMGCSQSTQVPVVHKTVDHRLPFTASQVDEIQTFWLNVKRKFEDTARDMLLR